MKRFILFWLFLLAMLALVACSANPTSIAVQLPPELVALLGMGVMVAITAFFKWLSPKIGGPDLTDQAAKIASAISAVLVLAINYGLALVPIAYDNFIHALFSFLIVFVGGTGIFSLLFRKKKS